MAATENLELLRKEAACPICLDFFNDPVMTDCGHNFCRVCINNFWMGLAGNVSCPECRAVMTGPGNLRVNRKLANMVEVAKRLNESREKSEKDPTCDKHKQPLQLFCEKCSTLLCVVCGMSREHKSHQVLPVEEAMEEYKEKLEQSLGSLRKQMKVNRKSRIEEERKIRALQKNVVSVRKRIVTEFDQLHQFLHEEQKVFFTKLDREEKRIQDILNANLKKLSEMSCTINRLIIEIEDRLKLQGTDILTEVGDTLERCDIDFRITNVADGLCIRECSFPLQYSVWKHMMKIITPAPAPLTLDPNTAHPELILSENMKAVRLGDTKQELLDNPERFTHDCCVLSNEGFTSGRHYWEVEVGYGKCWNVGVVKESVKRKGGIPLTHDYGVWTVGRWRIAGYVDNLVEDNIGRIGVYLDYEGGQLSFFNADDMSVLYSYNLTFTEKMFPYFFTRCKDPIKIVTSVVIE